MFNFGQTFAVQITSWDRHTASSGGLTYADAMRQASKAYNRKSTFEVSVLGEDDRQEYASFYCKG